MFPALKVMESGLGPETSWKSSKWLPHFKSVYTKTCLAARPAGEA